MSVNVLRYQNYSKGFFKGFLPLLKLINECFWKNFFGPFFAFIFPLIFIVILGLILGYTQILAGSLAISPMSITLSSVPQLFFEFKNSTLLKRIGATPIKPALFVLVAILFYLVIILISIAWCILFSLLMFGIDYWTTGNLAFGSEIVYNPNFLTTLKTVNWFGFFYGEIILIILGLLMGLMLVAVCKTYVALQAIGITIIIYSEFLCAMVLPLATVKEISGLWYVGYVLTPFKPVTNTILESWNGNFDTINYLNDNLTLVFKFANPFIVNNNYVSVPLTISISNYEGLVILDQTEKIISLVLPYVWILIFGLITVKKWKWSSR